MINWIIEQEEEQSDFEGKTDTDAIQVEIRSQNRKRAQIQNDIKSLEEDISIMQKSMEARWSMKIFYPLCSLNQQLV